MSAEIDVTALGASSLDISVTENMTDIFVTSGSVLDLEISDSSIDVSVESTQYTVTAMSGDEIQIDIVASPIQVIASVSAAGAASSANQVDYSPSVVAYWENVPDYVDEALDELARVIRQGDFYIPEGNIFQLGSISEYPTTTIINFGDGAAPYPYCYIHEIYDDAIGFKTGGYDTLIAGWDATYDHVSCLLGDIEAVDHGYYLQIDEDGYKLVGLSPNDNDVLTYDTATGTWKPEASAGGGGGAFQRVLSANLTLADGECVILKSYIDLNDYDLTLEGDADLVIL